MLEPVPSQMVQAIKRSDDDLGGEAEAKAMTADEHLMSRLKATYLNMYRNGDGEKTAGTVATA